MALKQGPARDIVFAEWQACMTSMGVKGCHGPPGSDRWLAKLFDMLAVTASNMEGVNLQIWSDNTNRGVGHHSGWLPFLQRMNVIRKAKATRQSRRARRVNGSKTVKTGKTIKCIKTYKAGHGNKTVKAGNTRVKAGVAKLGKRGRGVKRACLVTHLVCGVCLLRLNLNSCTFILILLIFNAGAFGLSTVSVCMTMVCIVINVLREKHCGHEFTSQCKGWLDCLRCDAQA
jgi:hypothetical protein